MSVKVNYKSKRTAFLNTFNRNKTQTLVEIGQYAKTIIKSETPVDTGDLRNSVDYHIEGHKLYLYSDIFYAVYVELGTFMMSANPFMRRGMARASSGFTSIILRNFKL